MDAITVSIGLVVLALIAFLIRESVRADQSGWRMLGEKYKNGWKSGGSQSVSEGYKNASGMMRKSTVFPVQFNDMLDLEVSDKGFVISKKFPHAFQSPKLSIAWDQIERMELDKSTGRSRALLWLGGGGVLLGIEGAAGKTMLKLGAGRVGGINDDKKMGSTMTAIKKR